MLSRNHLSALLINLEFTQEFKEKCRAMGFERLEDILCCLPADLINHKEFSYGWLAELTRFLNEKGMLHLLQSIPGRSSG